jgi:hypothetical protein
VCDDAQQHASMRLSIEIGLNQTNYSDLDDNVPSSRFLVRLFLLLPLSLRLLSITYAWGVTTRLQC